MSLFRVSFIYIAIMHETEVFISGGGIAGLTLALKLAKSGLTVAFADPIKPTSLDKHQIGTRTCAVMSPLLPLLSDIGVLEDIEAYSAPLYHLKIIDKDRSAHFSAKEIGEEQFSLNIPNNILKRTLIDLVQKEKNIVCLFDCSASDFKNKDGFIEITLSNKDIYTSKLLVGADGYRSIVRENLGIKTNIHDYGQSAHTCRLSHTKSHENISTETYYEDGPFTLVPLQGNTSSLVWLERQENAEKTLKLSRDSFLKKLQAKSNNILGTLSLLDGPDTHPIKSMIANQLYGERAVLIAEAAHALSPVGAQGLNTSLRDIQTLADLIISQRKLGLDIGASALCQTYEKQRFPDIKARFSAIHSLNKTVASQNNLIQTLRGSALSLVNDNQALRKLALKTGFGQ